MAHSTTVNGKDSRPKSLDNMGVTKSPPTQQNRVRDFKEKAAKAGPTEAPPQQPSESKLRDHQKRATNREAEGVDLKGKDGKAGERGQRIIPKTHSAKRKTGGSKKNATPARSSKEENKQQLRSETKAHIENKRAVDWGAGVGLEGAPVEAGKKSEPLPPRSHSAKSEVGGQKRQGKPHSDVEENEQLQDQPHNPGILKHDIKEHKGPIHEEDDVAKKEPQLGTDSPSKSAFSS